MVSSTLKKSYHNWTIIIEYAMLCDMIVDNTVVLPHQDLHWCGVILPSSGPYSHLSVRFTLFFPEEYPKAAPVVHFDPPVPHPAVDQESGRVDLKSLSNWDVNKHCAVQVLSYMRQLFHGSEFLENGSTVSIPSIEEFERQSASKCLEGCLIPFPISSISSEDEEWLRKLVQEAVQTMEIYLGGSVMQLVPVRSHVECLEIVDELVEDLWDKFLGKYSMEKS